MKKLKADVLQTLVEAEFIRIGAEPVAAAHVARSTCTTSLRGTDSHGIHLLAHYHRAAEAGRVNNKARIEVTPSGATARVDADHAFGHHAGSVAIAAACELAQEHGLGAAAVRDSTHFGAAAYYALQASERGLIGLAFTNADALTQATGSALAFFGTNPICFTAPLRDEAPFCLDMATSQISWNRVRDGRVSGEALEPGWAATETGEGTTDPNEARTLLPAGGYKGYGLGMMVEILCGVLAGGPVGRELLAMYTTPIAERRRISHFFMAVDPGRFLRDGDFPAQLQNMVDEVRRLPALDAENGKVMVPGDPEKDTERERSQSGIPIGDDRYAELCAEFPGVSEAVLP